MCFLLAVQCANLYDACFYWSFSFRRSGGFLDGLYLKGMTPLNTFKLWKIMMNNFYWFLSKLELGTPVRWADKLLSHYTPIWTHEAVETLNIRKSINPLNFINNLKRFCIFFRKGLTCFEEGHGKIIENLHYISNEQKLKEVKWGSANAAIIKGIHSVFVFKAFHKTREWHIQSENKKWKVTNH